MLLEGEPSELNSREYTTPRLGLDGNLVAVVIHWWGDPEHVQDHRYVDE